MFLTRRGNVYRYDLEGERLEAVAADLAEGDVIRGIAAGSDFVYVLLSDGTLKCRGKNKCGQLATLDEKERKEFTFVEPLGMYQVRQIACGTQHCAAVVEISGASAGLLTRGLYAEEEKSHGIEAEDGFI